MHSIRLQIDYEALSTVGVNKRLFGKFFFDLDDDAFPSLDWEDCPIIVLSWWLRDLLKCGVGEQCELDFMEGPYQIICNRTQVDKIEMAFLYDGVINENYSRCISYSALIGQLTSQAKLLLVEAKKLSLIDADYHNLKNLLTAY